MYGFGPVTGAAAGTAAGFAAAPFAGPAAPLAGAAYGAAPMAGYGYGAAHDACGFGAMPAAPVAHGFGAGRGFALIVVLFILLVIIGASWATPAV
ncbi:MAG: YjcZ family sporulation protein [Anaerobacillus sp.]|uniref:YjcZ family sporulation protein n=1 Tax=Anaerobacillus sp. TaxID=1872506 RepID=UPI00391AB906